jgi:hypothetical protein
MKYLLRDDKTGFREVAGEPIDSSGPLRPWAVTSDGRVVYAPWKQQGFGLQGIFELAMGRNLSGTALKGYDKEVSLSRRREFETHLAQDANAHPECVKPAVDLVTVGLLRFVGGNTTAAGRTILDRCYGDTASGRLGTSRDKPATEDAAWGVASSTLRGADIPKILGIQASLANVLTRTVRLSGTQQLIYDDTANKVAPKSGYLYQWFNSDAHRGRKKHEGGATATSTPGLTSPGTVTTGGGESRKRGIDEWDRVEGSHFIKGIDMRNVAFGAGRSGTTGELLKAYRTFGAVDNGESFKQYLLAIVIYLVTGGHHSCHEIFSVANLLTGSNGPRGGRDAASVGDLARGAYVPGKYVKHLPDSYLSTVHFALLKQKYYDIAMLGHLHGTFV